MAQSQRRALRPQVPFTRDGGSLVQPPSKSRDRRRLEAFRIIDECKLSRTKEWPTLYGFLNYIENGNVGLWDAGGPGTTVMMEEKENGVEEVEYNDIHYYDED